MTRRQVTDTLRWADEQPDQAAVECAAGTTSWARLAELSRELAGTLHTAGARAGGRIGVVLHPGRDAVATALAAHWLGCAYVPIDPQLPDARIAAMLDRCRPAATVAEPGRGWAGQLSFPVADRNTSARPPPPRSNQPDEVAYVVHTSGSTGAPRAIEVTHSNLDNLLAALDHLGPVPDRLRGSWWTRPSFDVSVWETWAPLRLGGTVVVAPDADRLEPQLFAGFLDRTAVASCYVPPSYLPALRDFLAADPTSCRSLRRLLVGVEPIPLALLQEIAALRPAATVLNGYGPAEATVCCTAYRVRPDGPPGTGRTPIGAALPGLEVYLLDPDGAPADEGELVVAGAGVARGYLGGDADPPRFVDDPGGRPGVRAYRTGDRVRRLPDGNLEFSGRLDRQLKVRGYRIEPGEVEAAVREVLPVREVVVGSRQVPGAGAAVVAYLVPEWGVEVDRGGLASALRSRLPNYALPAAMLVLDAMPQTSNGKIDHEALADLPLPQADAADEPEPELADSSVLGVTVRLCRRLLHTPIRPADNLIEFGATSLTAARLAAELRAATGRLITASDVLAAGSGAELAELLAVGESAAESGGPARPDSGGPARPDHSGPARPGADRAPLTGAQLGLWLHEQLTGDPALYVETYACEFRLPPGQLPALAGAIEQAISRHRVFGAVVTDDPMLVLADLPVVLRQEPLPEDPAQLQTELQAEARRPFELARGPLMRARLLVGAAGRVVLQFCWHHLAVDGWTLRLFLDDVATLLATPDGSPPAAVPTYCDLLLRQAEQEPAGPELQPVVDDLAAALAGAGWLPASKRERDAADQISVVALSEQTQRRLLTAPPDHPLPAVLAAALIQSLAAVADLHRPLLAFATAGRQQPGSERVAGYLVDAVLLDCPPAGAGLVGRTAAAIDAALAAQREASLLRLVRELRQHASSSLPVAFPQLYLSVDDLCEPVLFGQRVRPIALHRPRARFPIALSVQRGADRVEAWFELSGSLPGELRDQLPGRFSSALTELAGQLPQRWRVRGR